MKTRRILSLVLALCIVFSLVLTGCGSSSEETTDTSASTDSTETTTEETTEAATEETSEEAEEEFSVEAYNETSAEIYDSVLAEFYSLYEEARSEVDNISLRYAEMAIAEAKLLETCVMLPTTADGAYYQISRVAPYTSPYADCGYDSWRFGKVLVTEEVISTEDYEELRSMWAELKGTGTYLEEAKAYLEENGYTLEDEYNRSYSSDPKTWDVFNTSRSADARAVAAGIEGLLCYDAEGVLQPALAESYEVSDDGLTYTFHLREGMMWVDSQGREIAEVTADDWVAAMQHLLDAQAGLESLVSMIVGTTEYVNGEITDMSEVGVEAVDDYTLVYTLTQKTPYFTTMLGYSIFMPLCRTYYESLGGTFGADYATSGSGTYGLDPDSIAYCGAFVISNYTANSTISYTANEAYWDYDNLNIHAINWYYNDGTDTTKSYNDFNAGTIDIISLSDATLEMAKSDGLFDSSVTTARTGSSSFMMFLNVNREAYANVQDTSSAVSPKTDEQKEVTKAAMNNVHFRRALCASVDRVSWNGQDVGSDLAALGLRNSYVPGNFVQLEEDVTISINGTDTTFPAGTYYGEIRQAQLDADGVEFTTWDPDADNGLGSSDGFDGWYNPEYAISELEIAIEELAAEGYTVDANNPITIDLPVYTGSETRTNMSQTMKQSIEAALEGKVVMNLIECADTDTWYYAGYYTEYGYEANYDVYDVSGWGPDYIDPSTYLDTFLPEYNGYMIKCIGIY